MRAKADSVGLFEQTKYDVLSVTINLWYYGALLYVILVGEDWRLLVRVIVFTIVVNSLFLKRVFRKSRPFITCQTNIGRDKPLPGFLRRFDDAYRFPSGSAAISAAVAVTLWAIGSKIRSFGATMVLVNGAQRLLSGAHRPEDIIAGWVSGTLTALAIITLA